MGKNQTTTGPSQSLHSIMISYIKYILDRGSNLMVSVPTCVQFGQTEKQTNMFLIPDSTTLFTQGHNQTRPGRGRGEIRKFWFGFSFSRKFGLRGLTPYKRYRFRFIWKLVINDIFCKISLFYFFFPHFFSHSILIHIFFGTRLLYPKQKTKSL